MFIALFAAHKFFDQIDSSSHPYVAPKENVDGTVDYALIYKYVKELDGRYWVLRLPKDWTVIPSEGEDPSEVGGSGRKPPASPMFFHKLIGLKSDSITPR
jgi:hypothetical protein